MKRAGLDYHERTSVRVHADFGVMLGSLGDEPFVAFTARGSTRYDELDPHVASIMVFGCEATGLSEDILSHPLCVATVTLPMMPNNRSLNLANTVAITVFDRWRQLDFVGSGHPERGLAIEGLELLPPDS
jgi:tRNA (cytidine/uridine-2'-O-)-methyltransferase